MIRTGSRWRGVASFIAIGLAMGVLGSVPARAESVLRTLAGQSLPQSIDTFSFDKGVGCWELCWRLVPDDFFALALV